jgi:Predicted signal-transduction protein containing cAMP-binding and CBS domains
MITLKIQEIMTKGVTTLNSNDSIAKAADVMKKINVGSIPVVENNKLVGIVTDRDIVLRNIANGGVSNQTISQVMSHDIVSVTPDTDVHEAADIMAQKQIRRLPVVQNGSLLGIVSIGDMAVESIFENEAGEALSNISRK